MCVCVCTYMKVQPQVFKIDLQVPHSGAPHNHLEGKARKIQAVIFIRIKNNDSLVF